MNRIRTLLSVLLVVSAFTAGAIAIFPAIHSASSSHVRSVPTVAAGGSLVEPTIKDPFSSLRRESPAGPRMYPVMKSVPFTRVRYLRGASSTNSDDHDHDRDRDHDHDHSRLLAVARIGQKPTMDKPNKYFNLFWCSLLISILGLSSFVVQRISKTIKMPNHLEDNYGIIRTDGESQVRAALTNNRCTARRRVKHLSQFNIDDLNDRYVRMTNKL